MISVLQKQLDRLRRDASMPGLIAGFIVTLIGVTSSAVLVFQAASGFGQSPEQAGSWLGSLCFVQGLIGVILSIRNRSPILIAWSTAGAALLISASGTTSFSDATGAFLFSAVLIVVCGITGFFERIMNRIPISLAQALLAGILLHFALDCFVAFKARPLLIGAMLAAFLAGRRFWPRLTMLSVLATGILFASALGDLHVEQIKLSFTEFHFTAPTFSWAVLLSVGFPLFVVTMASQNLTGLTVMRAYGFPTPTSKLLVWTGIGNLLTACFGGFALNLAAITAAIAMGPEAHPQKEKRYFAAVVSGILYMILGLLAGTVTTLFAAFPAEMITAIAGLALLATIAGSLHSCLSEETHREAAFVTFAVTASGLTLFGIGPAFWGLVAGGITLFCLRFRRPSPL